MRLGWNVNRRTKEITSFYVQKSVYVDKEHDNKTVVVRKLGSPQEICTKYGVTDARAWAQAEVKRMNEEEAKGTQPVTVTFRPDRDIPLDEQRRFNVGYLFLQDIYYRLGMNKICKAIAVKHQFQYNLNSIMSKLIYGRILYPGSKLSTFEESMKYIERPDFELHDIYRALSVIAEENDYIQGRLFKNSTKIRPRRTGAIYYDCTNFYFETEMAEDDRQYGVSKENRPLPIVEMGLFMDQDGIPISFAIDPGNTNEQCTMIPLEKKMLRDFDMSKFIVCTDAGLSSFDNRLFNDYNKDDGKRAYISTTSIKKMTDANRTWALETTGWYLSGQTDDPEKTYNLTELFEKKESEANEESREKTVSEEDYSDRIFYKKKWIKERKKVDGVYRQMDTQLIVSFSFKYRKYQETIRSRQIERALRAVEKGKSSIEKKRPTDYKRFIKTDHATADGEVADKTRYYIDEDIVKEEAKYDGFYAVSTNLEDNNVDDILRINKQRWEIEECFRIMKTDFEARPVYLHRQERIVAHFITCFIALIVYRYLEKEFDDKYTITQLLDALRSMDVIKVNDVGYIPAFNNNEVIEALCTKFNLDLTKELITSTKMRDFCAETKKH